MRIASILRHRLSISILVLVVLLTASAYTPPQVAAVPVWCEEMGCVEWSAEKGCIAEMFCCVFSDGGVMCWRNGVLVN
jgi:hypothetical protein